MRDMRTIHHKRGTLHVETPLGIVNITVGLNDTAGRRVEAVTFRPNNFAGEPKVVLRGSRFVELKTKKGGK
jgi:hypothetical protein